MPDYWPRAKRYAKQHTKNFTYWKAVPSVLGSGANAWLSSGTPWTTNAVRSMGVAIASYAVLHIAEYAWNLLVHAPVALDKERDDELNQIAATAVDRGDTIAALTAVPLIEQDRRKMVARIIEQIDDDGHHFLRYLLSHGSMPTGALGLPGKGYMQISRALTVGRRESLIVDHTPYPGSNTGATTEIPETLRPALDWVLREKGY